jgi:hypothetical protein
LISNTIERTRIGKGGSGRGKGKGGKGKEDEQNPQMERGDRKPTSGCGKTRNCYAPNMRKMPGNTAPCPPTALEGNEQPAEKRTFFLPKTRRAASAGLYGPQRPYWSYYGHFPPPFLKWRPHFASGAARFQGREQEAVGC